MMSDLKSKLPDLKELGEITGKLFKDLRTSVSEIISNYKEKHAETAVSEKEGATTETVVSKTKEVKIEEIKTEKPPAKENAEKK